jgi:lipoprotein-anchoring transpeptidase ErfK/SrfK
MPVPMGRQMKHTPEITRRRQSRAFRGLIVAGTLLASTAFSGAACAQVLGYAPAQPRAFLHDSAMGSAAGAAASGSEDGLLPERLRPTVVEFDTIEAPGTVIIDTGSTALYYVLGQGRAIRYGVGVGREGFTWAGVLNISRKAEWPDWYPPAEMISRQPYLPRFVAGGPGNPLGARAMYLGSSQYRIHGTNDPTTIGKFVSSGCIRMTNEDVIDLFDRVGVGTRVVVLRKNTPLQARDTIRSHAGQARPAVQPATRRQAMNEVRESAD